MLMPLSHLISFSALATVAVWGLSSVSLTVNQMYVVSPILAIIFIFIVFCLANKRITKTNLIGEIGFIYLGFILAYTILPTITFLKLNFDFPEGFDSHNFSVLSPTPSEIGAHLWRHTLLALGVVIGYLTIRWSRKVVAGMGEKSNQNYSGIVLFLLAGIIVCIISVILLSAPVSDYYSHYTRYDHLSWGLRRLLYLLLIFKTGATYVVLALMFSDFRKYRIVIIFFLSGISLFELTYSLGSRIETLTLLLAALCFYHLKVRFIDLRKGIFVFAAIAIVFTAIESYRAAEYDFSLALEEFYGGGVKIAYEFGAVLYTSFHVYSERIGNTLPSHHWLMLFSDFLSLVPFIDHTEYNSQYWYARNYFPDSLVPPQTMGPLADSGIWGGEIDLFLRGILTGVFYGWLARWFFARSNNIWVLVTYVYFYATCVIGLKYSFIFQLSGFLRYVFPVVFCVAFFLEVNWNRKDRRSSM